jgi:hypothetical protein
MHYYKYVSRHTAIHNSGHSCNPCTQPTPETLSETASHRSLIRNEAGVAAMLPDFCQPNLIALAPSLYRPGRPSPSS